MVEREVVWYGVPYTRLGITSLQKSHYILYSPYLADHISPDWRASYIVAWTEQIHPDQFQHENNEGGR